MFDGFFAYLGPILAGWGLHWFSGKCRGRNARNAFRYAAWGAWLLLLIHLPIGIFPFPLGFLNLIVKLAPSVICFWLAASSILKEMRAQKEGEFTDAA
ncbi:MAG: hypothetical protein RMJ43_16475 [Chloroherpetonaceae bacterium]|nr:hypothetical protein [Chthonomonadaceae bacterium]MDW8209425.1 hypothetical protein [Chloroherpetonaceae bacterium]